MKKKITQYIILTALFLCVCFALILIAGDEVASEPMSDIAFLSLKLCGLSIFGACIYIGKKLNKAGLLPSENQEED